MIRASVGALALRIGPEASVFQADADFDVKSFIVQKLFMCFRCFVWGARKQQRRPHMGASLLYLASKPPSLMKVPPIIGAKSGGQPSPQPTLREPEAAAPQTSLEVAALRF